PRPARPRSLRGAAPRRDRRAPVGRREPPEAPPARPEGGCGRREGPAHEGPEGAVRPGRRRTGEDPRSGAEGEEQPVRLAPPPEAVDDRGADPRRRGVRPATPDFRAERAAGSPTHLRVPDGGGRRGHAPDPRPDGALL